MTPSEAAGKIINILEEHPERWTRYTIGYGYYPEEPRCLRGLFMEVSRFETENSKEEAFAEALGFHGLDPVQNMCNWNNSQEGPEAIISLLKEIA